MTYEPYPFAIGSKLHSHINILMLTIIMDMVYKNDKNDIFLKPIHSKSA